MFWPAMVAGSLWANLYSTKELDEVGTLDKPNRSLSKFWGGVILGGVMRLWVGMNFGPSLKTAWNTVDRIAAFVMPSLSSPPSDHQNPVTSSDVQRNAPVAYQTYPA